MLRHAATAAARRVAAPRRAAPPIAHLPRAAGAPRAASIATAHTRARGTASSSSSSPPPTSAPLPPRRAAPHVVLRADDGRAARAQPAAAGAPGRATVPAAAAAPATSSSEPVSAATASEAAADARGADGAAACGVADDADLPTLAAGLRSLGAAQPRVTFLLGGPGAGKGTLSERITAREGHAHVSVGALLRAASASGTAAGRRISATMSRGGMVGSTESTSLLLRHLLERRHRGATVVVDGYPRTFANAVMFDSLGLRPARVIALELDERVMWARLSSRGRRDDVPEIVRNRLVQFRAEWESIKEFYRRRELLVELDGDGDAEAVWKRYEQLPMPSPSA